MNHAAVQCSYGFDKEMNSVVKLCDTLMRKDARNQTGMELLSRVFKATDLKLFALWRGSELYRLQLERFVAKITNSISSHSCALSIFVL